MSSLLDYVRTAGDGPAHAVLRLVWAGHEPQEFINYFPQWRVDEDVKFYNREVREIIYIHE